MSSPGGNDAELGDRAGLLLGDGDACVRAAEAAGGLGACAGKFQEFGGLAVAAASVVALKFEGQRGTWNAPAQSGVQGCQGVRSADCSCYIDCGSGGVGGDGAMDQFEFGFVHMVAVDDEAAGAGILWAEDVSGVVVLYRETVEFSGGVIGGGEGGNAHG